MNTLNKASIWGLLALLLSACGGGGSEAPASSGIAFATEEALGEALFHDTNLSMNRTQACATCHDPEHAFIETRQDPLTLTGSGQQLGVSLGDDASSIGTRNTPTAAYARFVPDFSDLPFTDDTENSDINGFVGGQFLDGREVDLKGQAGGPPLNPVEMNMPDKASVIERLKENAFYVEAFEHYYGENILDDVDQAYLKMTTAIGKFEKTDVFAPFDSKWDKFLNGEYTMTLAETSGMAIFMSPANSSCVSCHLNDENQTASKKETFTNFRYFNLGVPVNSELRNRHSVAGTEADFVANGDPGLFGNDAVTDDNLNGRNKDDLKGKFKTPTLRNVAVTGPYMHNGAFKELSTVLKFYDFRGSPTGNNNLINPETGEAWDVTDYPATIDHDLLGQQAMGEDQIKDLECFLRLLTDERYEHLLPENSWCKI
ncbi:cytochrome c peroxidase [Thiomicrorhabdus sp.]|uniref:cytochrome-c peroxidase n=1 Tax=Thiomicrorhabdus sp. TaxID=2039724 RepID=UPI0029C80BDF|nr:cytochrome c peroxidase [Thiomicrorhabdus sp.]